MGFSATVAGVCSGILVGVVVDRYGLSLQRVCAALVGLLALSLGLFTAAVYATQPKFWPVFTAVVLVGVASGPVGSLQLEMAADLTFPVSEETSATVLCLGYALVSVTAMPIGGALRGVTGNLGFTVMLALAAVGLLFVSKVSERKAVDASCKEPGAPNNGMLVPSSR